MTTEEQIQRYKELLGLITQGEWQVSPGSVGHLKWKSATHSLRVIRKVGGYVCEAIHRPGSYRKEAEANAEFITLSRNLAQPLLDAWEENQIYAGVVADWVGYTHRARAERDAALERERVLKQQFDDYIFAQRFADQDAQDGLKERDAALERERVLVALLQGIADVDLTGWNWTPAQLHDLVKQVQQVLTPEPKPCKDWRHTSSLLTGVWTLEDGTKKDFGPQHIIACPTCQPAGSEYLVFCGGCGFKHKSGYVDCVYMKEI